MAKLFRRMSILPDPCDPDPLPDLTADTAHAFLTHLTGHDGCADPEAEIRRLGLIIDLAGDLGRGSDLEAAVDLGTSLLNDDRISDPHSTLVHYFLSNAWESLRTQARTGDDIHAWEQPELEKQIVHLRLAARIGEAVDVHTQRLCQILTNLGNLMSHCGRIVEAMAAWDRGLDLDPTFPMALGNRGYGLFSYGHRVHDPGHKAYHYREAHDCLTEVVDGHDGRVSSAALEAFRQLRDQLREALPSRLLEGELPCPDFTESWSDKEREYRTWCLERRLFLNDLNDLGLGSIAAADVLTLPSITTAVDAPQPSVLGFFNQLKQEFVSARYLYFAGTREGEAHFSDRDVTMLNTLDYPVYGLAIEKVKASFRISHSLFDKVSYLLNDYLGLGIPQRGVTFRSLWYQKGHPKHGLRSELGDPADLGLKGLFWVAKDLYEESEDFQDAIEPDAREISSIRNHLEHKYLKLHSYSLPEPDGHGIGYEALAHSLTRTDFEAKTLRLLQLSRAALVYLVQGIYYHESKRQASDPERITAPMFLDTWEDDWKF